MDSTNHSISPTLLGHPILEGWMLKKKRKKMQGFARRYFYLSQEPAVLSYSFSPNSRIRDSVLIKLASISISRKSRSIHIDSGGSLVMHIKTLSDPDFLRWTKTLQSLVTNGNMKECQRRPRHTQRDTSKALPRYSEFNRSDGGPSIRPVELSNLYHSVARMQAKVFQTINEAVTQLKTEHLNLIDLINIHRASMISDQSSSISATHTTRNSRQSNNPFSHAVSASDYMPPSSTSPSQLVQRRRSSTVTKTSQRLRQEAAELTCNVVGPSVDDGTDSENDTIFHDAADDGLILILKRRTTLPSPICGDEFSIFSMLKKNVGKDLSQISFPISFNEPLSATQKICEECEYVDELLAKAAQHNCDPLDRLMYIAGFVVSGFCHTKTRAIRKPFNPMLGETYECIRSDKGMKFLSEKVVHHPPMIAAYAEGKNWKLEINSSARQKFWGQSLEIIPEGLNRLTIFNPQENADTANVYEWDKPSSKKARLKLQLTDVECHAIPPSRNLVSGTKYLEHIGKVTITKQNSTEKATVEFKPGSTFGGEGSRNKVEVKVYDGEGRVAATVHGKWDSYLSRTDTNDKLFEAHPLPARSADFYGLTQFAIELNELSGDVLSEPLPDNLDPVELVAAPQHIKTFLPPTDSRLRPDLRLFELGLVEQADLVKKSLEDKQRARRRLPGSETLFPTWFQLDPDGKNWVYKGGYFENRLQDSPQWVPVDLF
ncbi:uncharacterized protein VP01_2143g2 [Puccinia sorghi]|uniref:PH domain-containing protein n=1 Tax=Puccinia sorghi TaxID=27349 RepID=A0A0L6V9V5_9BASI|nr:uncharacterized protein VP01_2143g2 [Puccinia sorghi]